MNVVPTKRKKVSENGHNGSVETQLKNGSNIHNGGNSAQTLNGSQRTIQHAPKILTARKRTKNGVLKAPTELWLV